MAAICVAPVQHTTLASEAVQALERFVKVDEAMRQLVLKSLEEGPPFTQEAALLKRLDAIGLGS